MTQFFPDHPNDERSDADPMIDALLAEFVSRDQTRRIRPPDLSARIIAQLASSGHQQRAVQFEEDDPIVDSLLVEFLPSDMERRKSPPDLTSQILRRLAESEHGKQVEFSEDADPVVDTLLAEFVPSHPARRRAPADLAAPILTELFGGDRSSVVDTYNGERQQLAGVAMSKLAAFLVAIAACIAVMMYLAGSDDSQNGLAGMNPAQVENGNVAATDPSMVVPGRPGLNRDQQIADSRSNTEVQPEPRIEDSDPIRGITLEMPTVAANDKPNQADLQADSQPSGQDQSVQDQGVAVPIALVASQTAETVRDYWSTLGITPTPDADPNEIADRLKERLGVAISKQALTDPQQLRDVLVQSANADEIARRWLALTTDSSIAAIKRPEVADLVQEVSRSVAGKSQLDVTLVSLIDGSSPHSGKWYETIGRGGTEGIAKRLAGIAINADVRCVRCHDSHIGRNATQDDYWSFVALVRSVVERKEDQWIVADQTVPVATFFERTDGRQSMATPKVSGYLLQSADKIEDFHTWTKTLVGSDVLAGSMVDSLWKLVHGRPLKPSPVDAFAPPFEGNLDRLHKQLAEDLKASGFDVARTLALVITSPMARRSVPEVLRGESLLTATDQQRAEALDLVYAFAASVQTPQSSVEERVDLAMRRIGGRLMSEGQRTMLAQPIDSQTTRDPKSLQQLDGASASWSFLQQLGADFPDDGAALPVSWLRSIDDFELKLQHLVYLSGRNRVTPEISDVANRLREAGSEESALSRVWWILRN